MLEIFPKFCTILKFLYRVFQEFFHHFFKISPKLSSTKMCYVYIFSETEFKISNFTCFFDFIENFLKFLLIPWIVISYWLISTGSNTFYQRALKNQPLSRIFTSCGHGNEFCNSGSSRVASRKRISHLFQNSVSE